MDTLFEGISSKEVKGVPGQYIRTPEGLCAGFVREEGSCGNSQSYALFSVDENNIATFKRLCNTPERKLLAKAYFHFHATESKTVKTSTKDECTLFIMRT